MSALFYCREEEFVDLEKKFEPNLLNSTMYLISMSLQLSTIAVNYKVGLLVIIIWIFFNN